MERYQLNEMGKFLNFLLMLQFHSSLKSPFLSFFDTLKKQTIQEKSQKK